MATVGNPRSVTVGATVTPGGRCVRTSAQVTPNSGLKGVNVHSRINPGVKGVQAKAKIIPGTGINMSTTVTPGKSKPGPKVVLKPTAGVPCKLVKGPKGTFFRVYLHTTKKAGSKEKEVSIRLAEDHWKKITPILKKVGTVLATDATFQKVCRGPDSAGNSYGVHLDLKGTKSRFHTVSRKKAPSYLLGPLKKFHTANTEDSGNLSESTKKSLNPLLRKIDKMMGDLSISPIKYDLGVKVFNPTPYPKAEANDAARHFRKKIRPKVKVDPRFKTTPNAMKTYIHYLQKKEADSDNYFEFDYLHFGKVKMSESSVIKEMTEDSETPKTGNLFLTCSVGQAGSHHAVVVHVDFDKKKIFYFDSEGKLSSRYSAIVALKQELKQKFFASQTDAETFVDNKKRHKTLPNTCGQHAMHYITKVSRGMEPSKYFIEAQKQFSPRDAIITAANKMAAIIETGYNAEDDD